MKKLLLAMCLVSLSATSVFAQAPYKVYTSPKLPMRDALERMNLVQAWNTRVTVDGNRDGIVSVQLIPGNPNQLVVQTYKGGVFLYDADNGDLVWKAYAGVPYWAPQPAAFNSHSIFVTRRNRLFVLSRVDGSQRVYTYDPRFKQADFGYPLLYQPISGPVADEDFVYLPMGDRINALFMPDFGAMDRAKAAREKMRKEGKAPAGLQEAGGDGNLDSPQPEFSWGYRFPDKLTSVPPLMFGDQISVLTTDGTLTSIGRFELVTGVEIFDFKAQGKAPAAPAQHLNMAYFGSDDFNLYAINMNSGRLAWRYVAGAPILLPPHANDRDVFVAPERVGMRRIDRGTGKEMWTNRDTQRFLAANDAYVYALDRHGRFYVIDSRRGSTLATHDLSDWAIAIPNEWTDRIYLAANDGQVMCLRRKDLVKPMIMKASEPVRIKEEKKPKEEPKKDEEKKDDKEKAAAPRPPDELALRNLMWRADVRAAPAVDPRKRAGR